jgi:hypothetical protein
MKRQCDESRILRRFKEIYDYEGNRALRKKESNKFRKVYNVSDECQYKRKLDDFMEDWDEYVGEYR